MPADAIFTYVVLRNGNYRFRARWHDANGNRCEMTTVVDATTGSMHAHLARNAKHGK